MDKIVEKILNKIYGPTWKERQSEDFSVLQLLFGSDDNEQKKNSYMKYYPKCNKYNDIIHNKPRYDMIDLDNINIEQIKREKGLDIISIYKYTYDIAIRFTNDRFCGAYIIVDEKKYTGSSRNIYRRLQIHMSQFRNHKSFSSTITYIYVYLTKNYIDAVLVEISGE